MIKTHPSLIPAMLAAGFTLPDGVVTPPNRFKEGWAAALSSPDEIGVYLELCARERVPLLYPPGMTELTARSLHCEMMRCANSKESVLCPVRLNLAGPGLVRATGAPDSRPYLFLRGARTHLPSECGDVRYEY